MPSWTGGPGDASALRGAPITSASPTNGYVLKYNSTTGLWEPVDPNLIVVASAGVTTWLATTNSDNGAMTTWQAQVNTADNTATQIAAYTPPDNSIVDLIVTFLAIKSTSNARYKQDCEACFDVTAGVVTEMGANTTTTAKTQGTTTNMAVSVDTSGGNIRAMVLGRLAETWRWTANLTVSARTSAAA